MDVFTRGLVTLLLTRLDHAGDRTEALSQAILAEDAPSAIAINAVLQRDLSAVEFYVRALEQLSGHTEVNARAALGHAQRRARLLRIHAWSLSCQRGTNTQNATYAQHENHR